jgi:hypothetical protein
MSSQQFEFEVPYTDELIDHAAAAFVRDYLFHTYGRWLILACIINLAGFLAVLWLGGSKVQVMLAFIAAIAVLGPVGLARIWFAYPRKIAERIKQRFIPSATFSMTEHDLSLKTSLGYSKVSLSRVKALLELPACLVLVFSPFACLVIPTAALSADTDRFLRARIPPNAPVRIGR